MRLLAALLPCIAVAALACAETRADPGDPAPAPDSQDGDAGDALAMPDQPPQPATLPPAATGQQGTLLLAEDGQTLELGCAGRNVLVTGNRDRLVLRGGCRSVTVQGHANAIRAELLPGARIAIGGDGVTLRYRLVAAGPPPILSVAGTGSRAIREDGDAP